MIAVVDYGRGNLFSLSRALDHVGAEHAVTSDAERILGASGIVLPGVGAFGDAMGRLAAGGLIDPLRQAAGRGVPLLGICLGMQLLFDRSTEFGDHSGLALLPGTVARLPQGGPRSPRFRIPNVGWRRITPRAPHPLLDALEPGDMFYFVHSHIPYPDDPRHVLATMPINGIEATAMAGQGNIAGCQFHPEKSGPVGLRLFAAFLREVAAGHSSRRSA